MNTPDLYHYTSVSGLMGIVGSKCLHATNIKYLNDSTEFHFGLDYFSKVISRSSRTTEMDIYIPDDIPLYDHLIELILNQSIRQLINIASDHFVVSFSGNPDLLSQWRAYGKDNVGYCIKFDYARLQYPSDSVPQLIWRTQYVDPLNLSIALKELEELKNSDWKLRFFKAMPWLENNDREEYKKMLTRMYALDQHESNFSLTDDERGLCPDKVDMDEASPLWYRVISEYKFFTAVPALSTIALAWKDRAFHEEDEYRMALNWNKGSQLDYFLSLRPKKFREGKSYLIPYIEIPYDFTDRGMLKEVIVGPCPHPVEAASSVRQLLAQNLINDVTVLNSKIPFRFW